MSQIVCFNELSISPLCHNDQEVSERVDRFINLYKTLYDIGYTRISNEVDASQVMLTDTLSLRDLCRQHSHDSKYILLATTWACPTIPNKEVNIHHLYEETIVELSKDGCWVNAEGFSWAVAANTLCAGFLSESFWNKCLFTLQITKDNGTEQKEWLCVSDAAHLSNANANQWIESHKPLMLKVCDLSVKDKKATIKNIRDDHGKDVLTLFAKRLILNPYVEGIINSLPFNRHESNFIHNISSDGKIELVLTNTDEGFGLVIQTTGRTTAQTDAIASILKKEFCK